jgi:ketosteroid isomerase-like protein
MKAALRGCAIALLLALSGPTAAQQASLDPSAEMQKQFAAAYNNGDLDAMAGHFTEDAMRVTPSGIFKGRDAIRRGFQDALKLGLHDYSVKRVSTRTDGKFIFNIGEWQAKVGDHPLHGYYTAILVQGDGLPRIMEETVAVAVP